MDKNKIKKLLEEVKKGNKSIKEALTTLENLPFMDLGFAKIDSHRELRMGAPEAIYCMNKTTSQIIQIIKKMKNDSNIIATRVPEKSLKKIKDTYPDAKIYPEANLAFIGKFPKKTIGKAIIVTAGTSDIPIARESEVTAKSMGIEVETIFDVGISGIHRVLSIRNKLKEADIAIVIAGMEGALPSVIAGLIDTPIIAVPTSVGYGASFKGISPLLTMLNSCAPGICVMNIDNGYSAGFFAAAVIKKIRGEGKE
ncbi:nickel pincer cofactor biosynthesis protein LarB [candidate division WOR-3 bacterium]|nr:nickel pincer cofactor biosynthesis protein LarB [candidate division WOR-3 bacterium]